MSKLEERLAICKECPLYKVMSYGAVCNPNLYMDDEGNISYTMKPGYRAGCGCMLTKKAAAPSNHCNFKRW